LKPAKSKAKPKEKKPQTGLVVCLCVFLALAVLAVFGQTAHFDFVNYNDDIYVYDNPVVKSGLSLQGVGWAFTHSQVANWIPLTTLSHMLDCQLFGLDAGAHHMVNVLLHAASAVLLFLILRQMTGALWRCAFVAAVFAVHPLRAESVAWISERKDVLSALFFMLTIGAYVRYVRRPSRLKYAAVMLLFALGLLAKSMLATLPFVLLLLDYWPLKRISQFSIAGLKPLLFEKIPLFALSIAACVAAALAPGLIIKDAHQLPFYERIGNALVCCIIYLRQMVFPAGLAIPYPYPKEGLPSWEVCMALVVLAAISAVVLAGWKKRPWLLVGWLWYLGMLFPVLGIIQITTAAAYADRYTYLPEIGVAIAVTWAVADWSAGWKQRRLILGGLMIGVVGALALCGYIQTSYWRDSETLWTRAIACTPANSIAHDNLGADLIQKGQVDEGIAQFQKALEIDSADRNARINLGVAFFAQGDVADAIIQYRKALEADAADSVARDDLGNALVKNGRLDEGIAQYQKVLEANPADEDARFNLGVALFAKGNLDEAIAQYRQALEINPADEDAMKNLAAAFYKKGDLQSAVESYQQELKINPSSAETYANMGTVCFQQGDMKQAVDCWQQSLVFNPGQVNIQNNLAWIMATSPDASVRNGAKAVELAQQAGRLSGGKQSGNDGRHAGGGLCRGGKFFRGRCRRATRPATGERSKTTRRWPLILQMRSFNRTRPARRGARRNRDPVILGC
jgi:tetratricopeptide (TPR) repeat protein